MEIGILDIQGDVSEHENILESLGVRVRRVRRASDLETVSGMLIPGGESTVIGSIMAMRGIPDRIIQKKIPVMGTCAGLILMSKDVEGGKSVLPLLDVSIQRNGYGSQRESFEADLDVEGIGKFRGIFIRAPKIKRVGRGKVLSTFGGDAVMVSDGKNLGLTFHPEIYGDSRIHKLFLEGL
ncbi:MAG: pyridoxal 5'-phosphate synthase glutaminase subunit PdxT [Candidatus Thermoplasmatota archaeon]|jgi:5'-phosphate synthase pdxT subunit|nr:pyridoxal 5'-phosphate synthase glutaminase subunit PdxT [Candidatus Thermoplasmatota archaeon]MCL5789241.1 pyridoxal 5'-phosphate synthase glutaminase subunit PdxT [Candidatus Thermoplasmatota archaeon]